MRRFPSPTLRIAAAVLALAAASTAAAQFRNKEDAIGYRQGVFHVMGNHFGRLAAMAKGTAPFDAKVAQENAALVATLAKLPWAAFPEGSDKGGDTEAKPAVWAQADKFKAAAEKFQTAAVALDAAAKTGELDKLKAAVGETGKTCKGCHETFKKD